MFRARGLSWRAGAAVVVCTAVFAVTDVAPALPQTPLPQTRPPVDSIVVPLGSGVQTTAFVPDAEEQLLRLVNSVRREHGLPPVVMNEALRAAARRHSHDMAVKGYLGHGSERGESFLTRLSRVVPAGTVVGENVTAALTTARVHNAFTHSEGHLKNIVNPVFSRVGIGVATAGDLLITTEDFAN